MSNEKYRKTISELEYKNAKLQQQNQELRDKLKNVSNGFVKQSSYTTLVIEENQNLKTFIKEACEVIVDYAGEPFEKNDRYVDIFDLIEVKSESRIDFDSDKFTKRARQFMNTDKYKQFTKEN